MTTFQLEDFFSVYPNPNAEDIQTLISSRKELAELASSITEAIPARGEYFKHQQLIVRLLMFLSVLILFHKTGTGKTCAFVAFAEYIRAIVNRPNRSIPLIGSNFKKVYILVRGPSLKTEFRHQLVCRCTKGQYETKEVLTATTESSRKNNLTRELKKWYSIMTYNKFATLVGGSTQRLTNKDSGKIDTIVNPPLTEQQIIDEFSDCIFFVDEAQNLRNVDGLDAQIEAGKLSEIPELNEKLDENEYIYKQLWRVFHIAQRTKIILGSATLMINSVQDLIPVMNLVLPANNQMNSSMNLNTMTRDQLEPYFRGKISFVRELDTGAVSHYVGRPLPLQHSIDGVPVPSQLVVDPSMMDQLQQRGYINAFNNPGAFRINERQASNFVFPDGTYGGAGYRTHVTDRKQPTPEFQFHLKQNLRQMSQKYYKIVNAVKNRPGIAFCYVDFVEGSGAIVLGLAMSANDIERFSESTSVFIDSEQRSGTLTPFCSSATPGTRQIRIPPKLRYAIITSETTENQLMTILQLANSYENRHGAYLKVIIGSPSTREGFNIKNGLQFHMVGPSWSPSDLYQALSRILRSDSHVILIEEERARLRGLGLDPATARVIVDIYFHVSTVAKSLTVDLEMYRDLEKKDREIKRIERFMKEVAVDCQIHYGRNVRPTDIPGSAVCDYTNCDYVCIDPIPEEIVLDTYDLNYSEQVVDEVIREIRERFLRTTEFRLDQIRHPRKYTIRAVQRMIDGKIGVVNRFGLNSYLNISGDRVFITSDYPLERRPADYWDVYYSNLLLGSVITDLENIIPEQLELNPADENINQQIKALTIKNRSQLIETAILEQIAGEVSPISQKLLSMYQNSIFELREPVADLDRNMQFLAEKGNKRGRPSKDVNNPKVKRLINYPIPIGTGENVYLHMGYSKDYNSDSYNIVSTYVNVDGRLRLYKESENIGWRDLNPNEILTYVPMIRNVIANKLQPYRQHPIYGTVHWDGVFRLTRDTGFGKVCKTFHVRDLLEIIWELQIPPPKVNDPGVSDEILIRNLSSNLEIDLSSFSLEKIMFYYAWFQSKRDEICPRIYRYLQANNLIFIE